MSRLPRWTSVMALIAVAAAAALVGPGLAGGATNVKSTVTITSGKGTQFTGKVSAAKKKCRAGRTVKLYAEADYTGRMGEPLVGTAKTNASGVWTMDGSFLAGVYYAQVMALLVNIDGMAYRCAGDLSLRAHF